MRILFLNIIQKICPKYQQGLLIIRSCRNTSQGNFNKKFKDMAEIFLQGITLETITDKIRDILKTELAAQKDCSIDEKYLSPKEVCNLFTPPVSKPTIEKWASQGKLNKIKIGGRVCYLKSEVITAMQTIKRYER